MMVLFIVLFVVGCIVGGYIGLKIMPTLEEYKQIAYEKFDSIGPNTFSHLSDTIIYDKNGDQIAKIGTESREKITYEEVADVLIDAIIATEDSRFYEHNGVDMARFLKASVLQLLGRDSAGGASTLTMQVAKNGYNAEKATVTKGFAGITRKFTDIYMAVFKMEKNFTKEEIIEYYVNTPCMGGNVYGVQQASKYYFNKDGSKSLLYFSSE